MKKIGILFLMSMVTLLINGCVEINSSDGGSMNIHPITIGPTDDYRPIYKVDSSRKVTAQSSVKCLLWLFSWGSDNAYADNIDMIRNNQAHFIGYGNPFLVRLFPFLDAKVLAARAAFYKACKENSCDAIMAARYEISFENYFIFKVMRVTVTGFPATLTSVEAVKPMPYYIDGNGKVVVLDKMVKPVKLFDGRQPRQQVSVVSRLLKDTLGVPYVEK